MKLALAVIVALVSTFAAVTYAALEMGGVAIVETQKEDGTTRTTRVWFARDRKELWLEAGSSSNDWFVDIEQTNELSLSLNQTPFRYLAKIDRRPAVQQRVRHLLRKKYGWRDWWVSQFVDQEATIPVMLTPIRPDHIPQGKRTL